MQSVAVCLWWAIESPVAYKLDDLNCEYGLSPGPPMCQVSVLTLSYIPPTQMMCLFSQLRFWKSKIHRLTGLFLERPFWLAGSHTFFMCPPHVYFPLFSWWESSGVSSFYKNCSAVGLDHCTVTLFDLNHPLKFPVCNAASLGVRVSKWEFREDTYILFITLLDLKFISIMF
jgi:hypothetical protein